MRIDWSTLALQLANFAILVWLLQRVLYRPVLRVLDARRAAADRERTEAARAARAAAERLTELDTERAAVAGERAAALERAKGDAAQVIAARHAQAEREAQRLMDEARKTIERERRQALEEAQRLALDLAGQMAQRVLAAIPEPLREQAWLERIQAYLKALPSAERAELLGELAGGDPLRVVTAAPLSSDSVKSWRASLREALGREAAITFEAESHLIGGAELHFPHATLSFSVQSTVASLQEEVRRHDRPH